VRVLEHRRHSRRSPGGTHLNRAGVALARRVGSEIGPFDRVVTSPSPRAVETAVALGFAVDAELRSLLAVPSAVDERLSTNPPTSFAEYIEVVRLGGPTAEFARRQESLWRTELERVPDGGRLLAISHGGVIEFGVAAAVPEIALGWGPPLGLLEGVRLYWDGERWTGGELLRVAAETAAADEAIADRSRTVTTSGGPSASIDRREPRRR
jgi:broad specificity phosphatase PhoE